MSWGGMAEIYTMLKADENRSGKSLACLQVSGEHGAHSPGWTANGVREHRKRVAEYLKKLDAAIKEHGAEKLCIRANH